MLSSSTSAPSKTQSHSEGRGRRTSTDGFGRGAPFSPQQGTIASGVPFSTPPTSSRPGSWLFHCLLCQLPEGSPQPPVCHSEADCVPGPGGRARGHPQSNTAPCEGSEASTRDAQGPGMWEMRSHGLRAWPAFLGSRDCRQQAAWGWGEGSAGTSPTPLPPYLHLHLKPRGGGVGRGCLPGDPPHSYCGANISKSLPETSRQWRRNTTSAAWEPELLTLCGHGTASPTSWAPRFCPLHR